MCRPDCGANIAPLAPAFQRERSQLPSVAGVTGQALVVHHDLRTVSSYFDHVVLINTRLVAHGPTETTFTPANLRKTYGGRLSVLDEAAQAVQSAFVPAGDGVTSREGKP